MSDPHWEVMCTGYQDEAPVRSIAIVQAANAAEARKEAKGCCRDSGWDKDVSTATPRRLAW